MCTNVWVCEGEGVDGLWQDKFFLTSLSSLLVFVVAVVPFVVAVAAAYACVH